MIKPARALPSNSPGIAAIRRSIKVSRPLVPRYSPLPDRRIVGNDEASEATGPSCAATLGAQVTLWRLIELKMELLVQCVPAFVLGARSARLREDAVFVGLLVGSAIAIIAGLAGAPRLANVHTGVVALGINALVATLGSCRRRGHGAPGRPSPR